MTAAYTQVGRPMRVTSPLGDDALLLAGLAGEEGVSTPYRYALDLLSTDPAIDPATLLGQPLLVELDLPSGTVRMLHGLVSRFRWQGTGAAGLHAYQAELVPWLWMLGLSADCRIFQQLSVPEIVERVFRDLGHADFQLRLVGRYPKREYCVQYRESHLAFVSRLLEEEGIFYFFRHEADRHVVVLADGPGALAPCPGLRPLRVAADGTGWWGAQDTLTTFGVEHAVHTARVTLTDYNWLTPSTPLEATVEGEAPGPEAFDYPGHYAERAEGDRYARLRLETHEAMREVATATSRAPGLVAGHVAEIDDGVATRRWLVLRAGHRAVQKGWLGEAEVAFDYTNDATCIPATACYHPPRRTPAPRAYGTQSALVTGPPGEEIHTDAHGRVKLHFFWDRHGRRDDTSSCWVRVSTAWAGKGWGQFSVPRVGQEVLVEFVEGHPDRPVVVGRVYNAEQTPPCNPAAGGAVSGMRSKTHRGSGYNAMEMDDTAGKEKIAIHAQHDLETTVQHDDTQTVVTGNRKIDVKAGTHTETIKGDTTITIVTGAYARDVQTAGATIHVKGAVRETFDDSQTTTVAHDVTIDGGDRILLKSGDSSILLAKDGTIKIHCKKLEVIGDAEIKASAPAVSITGGDRATLATGRSHVTCEPSKLSVGGDSINATAMNTHEIVGALVKIN